MFQYLASFFIKEAIANKGNEIEKFAQYCLNRLERIVMVGERRLIPSASEIANIKVDSRKTLPTRSESNSNNCTNKFRGWNSQSLFHRLYYNY
jgi:hypothetical protein